MYDRVDKARYYSSVGALYALTLLFAFYAVFVPIKPQARAILASAHQPYIISTHPVELVSGRPVRIVIADSGIDLPVDQGYYDAATSNWTLSGYHAQFAMISNLANNQAGETFIYGHNNNSVFGALRHHTPLAGAQALIYTDNGHVFAYTFQKSFSLSPNDTSVLDYSGAPIMTIQTCTGSLNEWRTIYQYNFMKVVQ